MAAPDPDSPIAGLGLQRALRLVRVEGFLGEVFVSLSGGAFLTGLALWLGAGPMALGLLVALPFIAQVAQLAAPLLERRLQSRRRFVVPAFLVGRLLWLIPAVVALLGLHDRLALQLAMAAVFCMALVGMVGVNGWTSWMADVVTPSHRALVFGTRQAAVATATMVAVPIGSLWLDQFRGTAIEGYGHAGLAVVAVLAGVLSAAVLLQLPDAPPAPRDDSDALPVHRRLFKRRRFRQVIGLFSTWNVSIGLPAAFWTLYMLQHLEMSFFLIGIHAAIVLGMRLLLHRRWTRLIDQVGSLRVLILCGFAVALIPLMWMIPTADDLWPIWLEAAYAGVFWTGFNQAAFIQPIAVLAPAERSHGLALYNVCTGAAMFVSALLGGVVLEGFGTEGRVGFFVLFAMATLIRLFVSMLALRLTEPGLSLHGFLVHFLGYGMLREWAAGRQWLPGDAQVPARRRGRGQRGR